MKVEAYLSDMPRGLAKASQVLRFDRGKRGRPPNRIRLFLGSSEDVDAARRHGVPVYLLTSELVTGLGYPVVFPPHLLVARDVAGAVESSFPRLIIPSNESVLLPSMEDFLVALLRVDALAARGIAVRHRRSIDPDQLLRRVIQAELEREATWVNLQEFAPAIPKVGPTIPARLLVAQDRTPTVIGLRA